MQNFIKRFLGIFLAALMVTSVVSASAVYTPVTIEDVLEAAETADSLTLDWYGTMDGIFFDKAADEGAVPEGAKQSLIFYKAFREGNFLKLGADSVALQRGLFAFSDVEAALEDYNARALQVEAMEQRVKEAITHANVTLRVRGADASEDLVCLDVLEWTFYDYDDTSVDGITTDAAGYGVEHKISLVKSGRYWLISEDEYEDSFLDTSLLKDSPNPPVEKEAKGLRKATPKAIANKPPVAPKYTYYSGYNVNAAVNYSNTWAGGRNPNYADFSDLGGDCANFTSQCINAGGMPQVVCDAYGSSGWFYKTGSNRSATWTGAPYLYNWMKANRGPGMTASNGNVWKGCPCFVDWYGDGGIDHAYFCVGRNSAGTAIINSHTGYQYHQVWKYGGGVYYWTVQLTSREGGGPPPPPPPPPLPKIGDRSIADLGIKFTAQIRHAGSGKLLTEDGTNSVKLYSKGGKPQTFVFEKDADGAYKISSGSNCLDLDYSKDENGTPIKMWTSNGNDAQRWFIHENGDGSYSLRPKCSGTRVIDLPGGSTTDGTAIHLYDFNDTAAQHYYIDKSIVNLGDSFTAQIRHAKSDKLLTGESDNDLRLFTRNDAELANQTFTFTRDADGAYKISSCVDGDCFDVADGRDENGVGVRLWTGNDSSAQRWFVILNDDGSYSLRPKCSNSRVLDLVNGNTADGAGVQLCIFNNTAAQRFFIDRSTDVCNHPVADLGQQFNARIRHTGSDKLLTDEADNGIKLYSKDDTKAQVFAFTRDADGSYKISSGADCKCLDVESARDMSGAGVRMWIGNDTSAQRWVLHENDDGSYSLQPKCTRSKVLDLVNGSTTEGATVQLYMFNDTVAQHFFIDKVYEDITPKDGSIDKTGGAFRGIQSGQNVAVVLACFEQEAKYLEICSSDGTKLGDDALVGTGCTVRIVNTTVSYVLIVIGDISGDGDITDADYVQQKNSLKGVRALEGAYNQAADINNDGICSALDIAALKFLIEG